MPDPNPRAETRRPMLMTFPEAAETLGVCERTVHNLVSRGELPAIRLQGLRCTRIAWSDLEAYLERSAEICKAEADAVRQSIRRELSLAGSARRAG